MGSLPTHHPCGSAFTSPCPNISLMPTRNPLNSLRSPTLSCVDKAPDQHPHLTHRRPLRLRFGRPQDRRVQRDHRHPDPRICLERLGAGCRHRRRHHLLRPRRPHRSPRLRDELGGGEGLDRHLPPLRRRPRLHRHPPHREVPRPVVPERIRPPPELDARLRPDDREIPPGRSPRAGGRGECVWVCKGKSGPIHRPKR